MPAQRTRTWLQSQMRTLSPLKILTLTAGIAAIVSIVIVTTVMLLRFSYPFELEWIEGAYVDEVRWIAQGHFPYTAPSVSFLPTTKPPLFFYTAATAMHMFGINYQAPRLVSIVATLGTFILLFALVYRETRHVFAGLVAAGLYAASFRFAGAWMDLAKTDSLFLFFLVAAFFIARRHSTRAGLVVSGILFVAAYYTKQLALPVIGAVAVVSLFTSRGRSWPQWATTAGIGVIVFAALELYSDGWFSFYTLSSYTYHDRTWNLWFFWRSMLSIYWPAILLSIVYVVLVVPSLRVRDVAQVADLHWHYLALGSGLVVASWIVFLKIWTYANGYMPAAIGLALLAAMGVGRLSSTHKRQYHVVVHAGVIILVIVQFGLLWYNPVEQIPTQADRRKAQQFIEKVRTLPGDVLVFEHGFVSYLAGKQDNLHKAPYADLVGGTPPPRTSDDFWRRDMAERVLTDAIATQRFDWLVFDNTEENWRPWYVPAGIEIEDAARPLPLTGAPARPQQIQVKNPIARGGNLPVNTSVFAPLFQRGWAGPEEWGRWMTSEEARLHIALEPGHEYELTVQTFPFCYEGAPPQALALNFEGTALGRETFTQCGEETFSFLLPGDHITGEFQQLVFSSRYAVSPQEVGVSADRRTLAVAIISISIQQR